MGFIKIGDAQPIIDTHGVDIEQDDEETKKQLDAVKQKARQTKPAPTKATDDEGDV